MTPQARRLALSVLALFGLLLFRLRPVRSPESNGHWRPAED